MAEGALRAHLPDTQWRPAVTKLGYSVGVIAVTLARQQLYTETTLTAYLPAAHDKTLGTAALTARLWLILIVSNLVGAFVIAFTFARSGAFAPEVREAFRAIGHEAMQHAPLTAFMTGILGGWIIALMVWLMPSAETVRFWVIIVMTWVLAVTSLTHIIAGSIEAFYLVAVGDLSFMTYVARYGIPVLIGNSIGGMVFVAALNRAQVTPDRAG
jgi:formate/nitrite transporter FocA (FNT family)